MERARANTALGRPLTDDQWAALLHFLALLGQANAHLNLTAIREQEAMFRRHVLESLALARLLEAYGDGEPACTLIDVGSGGGVPGVPLAIVWPSVHVLLLDATAKKVAFLRQTIDSLALTNTSAHAARAEEAGQDARFRESAALVTARAVASLDTLAELTLPLTRVGGLVAAIKGPRLDDELSAASGAITACGGALETVQSLDPFDQVPARVALIRKVAPTPMQFPRRSGIPSKRPLR